MQTVPCNFLVAVHQNGYEPRIFHYCSNYSIMLACYLRQVTLDVAGNWVHHLIYTEKKWQIIDRKQMGFSAHAIASSTDQWFLHCCWNTSGITNNFTTISNWGFLCKITSPKHFPAEIMFAWQKCLIMLINYTPKTDFLAAILFPRVLLVNIVSFSSFVIYWTTGKN